MAEEVKIDKQQFHKRLSEFISAWKADKRGEGVFGGANSIVIAMGQSDTSEAFQKRNAMHFWLLGYEFPATLMLFTTETLYIVTTVKKVNQPHLRGISLELTRDLAAKHLEPLKGGKVPIEILVRGKDTDQNAKHFEKCLEIIKEAGKRVGVIAKDNAAGKFIDEWKAAYGQISKDVEEVDISVALSMAAFAIKDEHELVSMRSASRACTELLANYFVEQMSEVLDSGKKVSHRDLADKIDKKLDEEAFFKRKDSKLPADFDNTQLDLVYGPIVQSGGAFDIKLSAQPDDKPLQAGVILAGIGMKYKTYCSILARTYLVDPTPAQETNYNLLHSIRDLVIKEAQEGVVLKDLYNKAISLIRSKKPELERHFVKSIGNGIGLEVRDSTLAINAKNTRTLKDGMTLCISLGFTELENPKAQDKQNKTYALLLTDTIRVKANKERAGNFTAAAAADQGAISFYFNDDAAEEQPKPKPKSNRDDKIGAVAASNITNSKLRDKQKNQPDESAEARRRAHQKELAAKKQKEGLEQYSEATGNANGVSQKKFKKFESYKRDNQFPSKVDRLEILVDHKASTVIFPIMGRPVPFHINTIKNASKSDEGDYSFLRINFLSPGQGVGRKDDQPFEDPNAHFVRSMTFRSSDTEHLENISQQITELRKNAVRREQEKKDLADVVEQDKLVEIRNRKPQRLENVYLRPALEGKRVAGEVEIHQNGLRYVDHRGSKVDVLFSNVKHLFFQPCTHELIVIIHLHLKNPILVGKKKTKDVQFYKEATDMAFDETGNRRRKHRFGDEEEFEQEQEERRQRAALDKHFKAFAERIQNAAEDELASGADVPFRELGFNGVPNRSNVLLQPTADCLVQLTEPPFLVMTLDEIEIAHLERVQFGLKNFDMVFAFKDFHRVPVHINTIPVENLEGVKDWLDSISIPYSEGPLNLNWGSIMKTIIADPHEFFVGGGWSFLQAESDSEDDDESEEESAFEMSDEDLEASDESSEDDSEFDDDASADEGDASMESESGGEDWDELEKKAKKKDRETGLSDEEGKKKRKR